MEMGGYERMKEVKEFDESKIGVKGLSESGITTIPNMFLHQHPAHPFNNNNNNINPSPTSFAGRIPIVDLSGLNSDIHRPMIVDQITEAARSWGFFQLTNHGVSTEVLDEIIAAIKGFHDLPAEEKAKYYLRDEKRRVRFTSNDDLYRSKAASWHDSLLLWTSPEPPEAEEIPEVCRREVMEWDFHAKKVAETIMEILCEGLGLEGNKFVELGYSATRACLGHCYPYCPQPDLTVGITPHTDPGVLTVLLQNHVRGLQVRHGERWVAVEPLHGSLVINIGDFLQVISNGEYKSVEHRVVANSSKEPRISVVQLLNADGRDETCYHGPLPELLSPEKPAIYRNFTMREHRENFYSKGLDNKTLIDKLKVA